MRVTHKDDKRASTPERTHFTNINEVVVSSATAGS
jgi:hypothetical protein